MSGDVVGKAAPQKLGQFGWILRREGTAYSCICLHEQRQLGFPLVQYVSLLSPNSYLCFKPYQLEEESLNLLLLSVCSGKENGGMSWNLRVHIALDIARGLEYLHDGVG